MDELGVAFGKKVFLFCLQHGRLKVKTTEEQAEAKRLEREKKVKIYQVATKQIFEKRKNGELDQPIIDLTGQILSANPDFYTLWNIRREVFLKWKSDKTHEQMKQIFDLELSVLESCLKVNPKGYGIWQHRCWVMDTHPEANWARELQLCNQFLEFDERNFHCWDYRRFVVQRSSVAAENEFDFTTTKINANFSNYSSWHYRSKLLPCVHGNPTHPVGVLEPVLLDEFELAQNAFFTDPNDQSAWFYHRWLLGKAEPKLGIECVLVSRTRCVVVFNKHRQEQDLPNVLDVHINGNPMQCTWKSLAPSTYSKIWECPIADFLHVSTENKINLEFSNQEIELSLQMEDKDVVWRKSYNIGSRFRYELSAATSDTLRRELDSCQQLHEMEPENKWTLLTILLLMRALDPLYYEHEIKNNIKKLKEIDPLRKAYYNDLRSELLVENAIECQAVNSRKFDLSGQELTSLSHAEQLCHITHLDLSRNQLTELKDVYFLQSLQELNVKDNPLDSIKLEDLRSVIPSLKNVIC